LQEPTTAKAKSSKKTGTLTISCRHLHNPHPDEDSKSLDPVVGVYVTSEDSNTARFDTKIGQTEHMFKNCNPSFLQTVSLVIPEGWKDRRVRFVLFDVDDLDHLTADDKVGTANCKASNLRSGDVTLYLDCGKGATVTIKSSWDDDPAPKSQQ